MQIFRPAERSAANALRGNSRALVATGLGACVLIYAVVLFKNVCFVAGGADSAGYLSAARLFSHGEVIQKELELDELGLTDDWINVFIPLGFIPGMRGRTIVPAYPPGVPLHMAAAGLIAGWSTAPFLVSPIAGLLCLALMYGLAREFRLSTLTALAAPVILGLCPTFIFQAIQPMSDVIATFWCLLAILCCLRSDRVMLFALAAGAAFGVAVLVRPNNLLLLAPILLALPLKPKPLLLFVAGGLPFAAFFLWYNAVTYGESLQTGYGSLIEGGLLAWSNFPPRFRHYTYETFWQLSPLVLLGWLATILRRDILLRRRLLLFVWPGVYLGFYSFYLLYETWWYLRFLLPALPAIIVGALLAWEELARRLTPHAARATLLIGMPLLLIIAAIQLHQVSEYNVLAMDETQSGEYVKTSAEAVRLLPDRAFIVSMQTSGALRYYTNFRIVRWDMLDNYKGEKLLQLTEERGQDLYALLFPFEVPQAQQRIDGTWTKIADIRGITLWAIKPRSQAHGTVGSEQILSGPVYVSMSRFPASEKS